VRFTRRPLSGLTALAEAGAAILPAPPAFYHAFQSIEDIVDFTRLKLGLDWELKIHREGEKGKGKLRFTHPQTPSLISLSAPGIRDSCGSFLIFRTFTVTIASEY
jgi:hypothetical protein